MKTRHTERCLIAALLGGITGLFPGSPLLALEAMSDREMASVSGRDGITVEIRNPESIRADQLRWSLDDGATDGSGNSLQNSIRVGKAGVNHDSLDLVPINAGGAPATHPLGITVKTDAFTNDEGRPGLALDARWNRIRARMGSLSVSDDTRSFGTLALDSTGRFAFRGDGGLFNTATDNASLLLNIGQVNASAPDPTNWTVNAPGQLFYRQNGPGGTEARLDRLGFLFNMHHGTLGIDSDGLLIESAHDARTDFNLTFDLVANADSDFETTPSQDLPMLFFGWRGGLEDFRFHLQPGGAWLPDDSVTDGVTTSIDFDLADDFQVVVGEAGDDRSYLEFADPRSLPSTLSPSRKDFEIGSLTLDAVSANQGVGPICYGGGNSAGVLNACAAESDPALPAELIDLPPTDTGLALITRGGGLHAYPSSVSYRDGLDSGLDIVDKGWALIYTLGDISSNVYLYPRSDGGITMDAVAAIQTIGSTRRERWEYGTHFMIGDTDKNMGIGLVGSDLLFAAREMDINLALANGGLQFYSDQGVRFQLRGMFGGGDIPDMLTPVDNSYFDMNLEFDEFSFNILPDIINTEYVAFGGFFSFANLDTSFSNETGGGHGHDDGSYIALAEPDFDMLDVDFRLADITGDIEIPTTWNQGGRLDLVSASSASNDQPSLVIQNRMNVGLTATTPDGQTGDPFLIDRVAVGGKNLGSMAIPGGRIQGSLTLKPK